jgi:hypothetical protein
VAKKRLVTSVVFVVIEAEDAEMLLGFEPKAVRRRLPDSGSLLSGAGEGTLYEFGKEWTGFRGRFGPASERVDHALAAVLEPDLGKVRRRRSSHSPPSTGKTALTTVRIA